MIGWKSLRNLDRVHLLVPDQLNTYDVLCSDDVVFTSRARSTRSSPARPRARAPRPSATSSAEAADEEAAK